ARQPRARALRAAICHRYRQAHQPARPPLPHAGNPALHTRSRLVTGIGAQRVIRATCGARGIMRPNLAALSVPGRVSAVPVRRCPDAQVSFMNTVEQTQTVAPHPRLPRSEPLVSVVIPCLNEAESIQSCVASARRALEAAGIDGEIIVADNDSDDDS